VLLLDKDGLLRNGASPGRPDDYLCAIDRLKPDPADGTCAAAAATGRIVITPNLLDDAGWKELRHLPLALGLRAAWSVPLVAAGGRILGTFGTYFRDQRPPRPEERSLVEGLARIAVQIIERFRSSAAPA
jgi:GAF domain-containing protein